MEICVSVKSLPPPRFNSTKVFIFFGHLQEVGSLADYERQLLLMSDEGDSQGISWTGQKQKVTYP